MNNQSLVLIVTLSLVSIIISILIFLISGFPLEMDTIYLTAIIGVLTAALVGIISHLRYKSIVKQLDFMHLLLKKNEEVIIDGVATCNKQIGKLFLTNRHVIFLPKSLPDRALINRISLNSISSVSTHKKAGLLPSGIILHTPKKELMYLIDFADDWKCLIEWQLLLVRAQEESLGKPLRFNECGI